MIKGKLDGQGSTYASSSRVNLDLMINGIFRLNDQG